MGLAITGRHHLFFEKKFKNLSLFIRDIYIYGKFRELFSFIIWEVSHKLRLFPKNKYLKFNNGDVITLEKNKRLSDSNFSARMDYFFERRTLNIERSEHNWKLLFIKKNGDIFGCVYPDDTLLYKSIDNGKSVTFIKKFPKRIKSIFVSSQNVLFVCVMGSVYKSPDDGESFKKILDMGSSESYFRHNNAITETPDNTIIIAEYGNILEKRGWRQLAYLYYSSDNGETWETSDFLIKKGTNKHVHLVKYSRLFNKIFMADGDNYKKLWVSNVQNSSDLLDSNSWKPITKFHIQKGGYTSVIEDDEKMLFGTDYQGGTNFLVETKDGQKFTHRIVPDPYRRSPIINMVQRKSKNGDEIWGVLPFSTATSKCLLMCSMDGGKSWFRVIEYNKANHHIGLLSSSNELSGVLYFSIMDLGNKNRVVYKVSD